MEINLSIFNSNYKEWVGATVLRVAWVVAFVLITFVGDRAGGAILSYLLLSSQARYSLMYHGQLSKEILFIGNSRGLHSFYQPAVEAETQFTALNLSYNAMTTDLAEAVLEDYYQLNKKPELIVIEVSMVASIENSTALFMPYTLTSENLARLLREQSPGNSVACRISHLYCLNSELTLRTLYYLNRPDQNWVNRYEITEALIDTTNVMKPERLKTLPDKIEILKQIVQHAKAQGIAVRLVLAPYLPAYADHISNLDQWLAHVESELGLEVLNYASAVRAKHGFADRVHLNEQGSRLFLDVLLRDGFFDPIRKK
jgi:hypothetical protein